MLYYTILYYAILSYTMLCYAMLYYTTLHRERGARPVQAPLPASGLAPGPLGSVRRTLGGGPRTVAGRPNGNTNNDEKYG